MLTCDSILYGNKLWGVIMNEERMKKEDLLELIKSLKISRDEFTVVSSGSLVLRGIYKDAGDLDIAVTKKGLEELSKNYNLTKKENGWYIVNDKVECVPDDMQNRREKVGDYFVQEINDYLKYLKSSNREKDKKRIPLVEEYIKSLK